MTWPEPTTLADKDVRLEFLSHDHIEGLAEAVRDGALWKLWYTSIPTPEGMADEITRRLGLHGEGKMLPFTVFSAEQVVGMTTFMNIDPANRRLEIGSTWYRQSAQRSGINTACKFLLLSHAFETLNCIAVEFRTHFFNHQSRRAIERLGAKLDGILRSHQIGANGTLRDTAVYSITAAEWPTVARHLMFLLGRQIAPAPAPQSDKPPKPPATPSTPPP